jgi:CRP/FNR family transcriptional regulator, nitrogen oxide reductase regulator
MQKQAKEKVQPEWRAGGGGGGMHRAENVQIGVAAMTANHWPTSSQVQAVLTPSPSLFNLKSRFLQGLTEAEIESVLAASTARRFPANSIVTLQGQSADYLFLLTKGCARYFSITEEGQKILLLWFGPGDVFGGIAILPEPSSYLLSTEMVKDSCVIAWPRSAIRDIMARYPRLQDNALSIASDYLAWFHASHMALVSHTARQRLARVLTTLAQGIGHKVPGGIEIDIKNEELANAANVTIFTASRLLSEWRRNGAVSKRRGSIVLHAPQRLLIHQV